PVRRALHRSLGGGARRHAHAPADGRPVQARRDRARHRASRRPPDLPFPGYARLPGATRDARGHVVRPAGAGADLRLAGGARAVRRDRGDAGRRFTRRRHSVRRAARRARPSRRHGAVRRWTRALTIFSSTSGDACMPFTAQERAALIERYAHGPTLLKRALVKVPHEALQWKPAAGRWSAHEIIVHCADSETNAHMRLRYLLAEPEPLIVGYDQDGWALAFDYHAHPIDLALA